MRGNARGIDDLCNAVHAAVDADCRADLAAPLVDLCAVVYDLRIGQRHERYHGHGEKLVDEDLVRDQPCDHRLSVVAVLHVVPVHPHDGVKGNAQIPLLADLRVAARALVAVDRAALLVAPQAEDHSDLISAKLVDLNVAALAVVFRDVVDVRRARAPFAGVVLALAYEHAPLDEDIGLCLHVAAVGVAEVHLRVLQHLHADSALGLLSGLHAAVPVGEQAAVAVHRRVAAEFADLAAHLVSLEYGGKLVV